MAPKKKPSAFKGVGRTIGGRVVKPKGKKAEAERQEAEYRPYEQPADECDPADKEETPAKIDQAEIQELLDGCQQYWTDDSDAEESVKPEVRRELERRLNEMNKSDVIMDKVESNTQRRKELFGSIIQKFSKQDKTTKVVDANEMNNAIKDPAKTFNFVPCLNGTYTKHADGSFDEVAASKNIYPCGCRVCRHRRKNNAKKRHGTLRSGKTF
ncbi:hypothetical protein EDD36DRAFT_423719 [Exophiala viscosa]|uniref:Uncharacterized protein n=1 Tax=Exophiala viscosa TaxID=2486360 RepID=A0AAN6DMY8_9EURO|nr:hypothetical protein EDD36DRAFT_423719 [Exophiala viscosa]